MKKHISYPKIKQFRDTVNNITRQATYTGLDDSGEATFDKSLPKPILIFKGTVKLHGTNASVCFNTKDGLWIQSRNRIITPEKDNAGFAFFAESNKSAFLDLLNSIILVNNIDVNKYTVSIYGEWAGKNVQSGVGISQLEKAFYVFGVKVSNTDDDEFISYWIDSTNIKNTNCNIYNVNDFTTYLMPIDFNKPEFAQNHLIEITNSVEKECPVAAHFGIKNGIGEGVVWSAEYKGIVHRFKTKGEKHSVSKVKKLASVDVEKVKHIAEFIEMVVTDNRFNQAIENVIGDTTVDIEKLGNVIRWVLNDVLSEESDTMVANKLEPKDVNKSIAKAVRLMFFKYTDKLNRGNNYELRQ